MDHDLDRAVQIITKLESILKDDSNSAGFLKKTIAHICNDHYNRRQLSDIIDKRISNTEQELELLRELKDLI